MYLAFGIRPDIAFVVGKLSKYNADPRISHLQVAKRVVRYLKGTIQISLVFRKGLKDHSSRNRPLYGFIGYADSNFAGDPGDQNQ